MYKTLVLIANFIAAVSLNNAFQNKVELNMEAPSEVVAGMEFEVKVTVKKGDLESFSRLQQELPAGIKATSYISSNADFSFEDERVRFIWMRMPRQEEFSVVYKLKADERVKGTFDIESLFSYIEENERKSVTVTSPTINILPSPDVDPSLIVDIEDYEKLIAPYTSPSYSGSQIACIRQKPVMDDNGEGYIVNILVNKEAQEKFAKVEENIPEGYKAVNINPNGAIFTFKDEKAKFLWMNLPSEPYFNIAYKLIPLGTIADPKLEGTFSYLEDDKTMSVDIVQTDQEVAELTASEINELIANVSIPATAEDITPVSPVGDYDNPNGSAQNYNNASENDNQQDNVTAFTIKKPEDNYNKADQNGKTYNNNEGTYGTKDTENSSPYSKNATSNNTNSTFNQQMLEPEEGVYYRVQLAAGHKKVKVKSYFKKFNLDKDVRTEYHEGWHKYSVGSFEQYKEARDYRVHIWNTTEIDDAFVAAYSNGSRITVQEALMIANQKWYK